MRLFDRWWCEEPPVRHAYLMQGGAPSEPPWRLITTVGDAGPQERDFVAEADARAAAQAFVDSAPGHWQRQPSSRSVAPLAEPG